MVLEFLKLYFNVTVISTCWAVSWFSLVSSMLHKRLYMKRCLGFCAVFCLVQILYNTFYLYHEFLHGNYPIECIVFTMHGLPMVLLMLHKYQRHSAATVRTVALGHFFISNFFYAVQSFFQ